MLPFHRSEVLWPKVRSTHGYEPWDSLRRRNRPTSNRPKLWDGQCGLTPLAPVLLTLDASPTWIKYTIWEVTKGMDVVKALTQRDPSSSEALPTPSKIISVTIEEK